MCVGTPVGPGDLRADRRSLLSDEEAERRPDKGKAPDMGKGKKRMRIELTPPPALAEEDQANIEEQSRYVGYDGTAG